jgi:hypothetical protein
VAEGRVTGERDDGLISSGMSYWAQMHLRIYRVERFLPASK